MSDAAAQFQFAAEFTSFLVAVAGLALLVLRDDLVGRVPWARLTLVVGLFGLAGASFGHGITSLDAPATYAILGLRAAGVLATTIGVVGWRPETRVRNLLLLSLTLMAVSVALGLVQAGGTDVGASGGVALAAGSFGLGAALIAIARRSIAARVAASAAGSLLLLVLVLSVGLSAVVANNVKVQAERRLGTRAATEAKATELASALFTAPGARITAAYLGVKQYDPDGDGPQKSVSIAQRSPPEGISPTLESLSLQFNGLGLLYLDPNHVVKGSTKVLDIATQVSLAGSAIVQQASCTTTSRILSSVQVIGTLPMAVGAVAECDATGGFVGTVVAVQVFDGPYLTKRAADDQDLSLAVAGRSGMLSEAGPRFANRTVDALVARVFEGEKSASAVVGDHFVVVRPVNATDNRPVLAVALASPTADVVSTRRGLFRTLFLIALGGTLLALALAAFVGDRIGAGLRRLTVTAAAIQGGDLSVRAAIESDDEIGILSSTFDAMADAIEAQSDALRLAAVDETRLRNRLETVVGGMGEALVAVDIEGRVTDFNRAAEELTGVNAASAKGRPATEIVVLTVEDGTDVPARLVHPGPQRWSASATVVQLDGGLVPVAVSAGVLRGADDEVAGNVFVFRDLRGEREIERMKTEFLSRVGHELRTPLTGIIGYSEILTRRDVPPERARVWHGEILAASKRLQRIVEMLEFFASSGAGRVLLRPEPIELRAVVDEVVTRWSAKVDPPTRVTRRVARGVPSIVADRRWLTLSLDELVDNAVKFSPDGGRIQITAAPADASRVPVSGRPGSGARRGAANGEPFPWVEIAVVDRGKGMSIQEQALAFGDFVQGDASDTRAFGGLGLGLSLVKRVVEGHGGMVDCESEPGRGSRFSILLPIVPIPPRK